MPRGQASKPALQDQELQKPSHSRVQQNDNDNMMARFTGEASLFTSLLLHCLLEYEYSSRYTSLRTSSTERSMFFPHSYAVTIEDSILTSWLTR